MNQLYIITPISLVLLINSIFLILLGFYLLRQGRYYFFCLLLFGTSFWAFCGFMENSLLEASSKIFWSKLSYIGVLTVTPSWFLFSLQYAQFKNRLIRRVNYFIWIIPAFILALAVTNEYHGLFWTKITPIVGSINNGLIYSHGFGVYLSMAYSYLLIMSGILVLAIYAFKINRIQRLQLLTLFLGLLFPWVFNFVYLSYSPELFRGVDITPVAFAVTGIFATLSIFKYKFSAIIPAAKDLVYSNLEGGAIGVNTENVVVDFNPMAKQILRDSLKIGLAVEKINLPGLTLKTIVSAGQNQIVNLSGENKWLDIHINDLKDRLGHLIGRTILLYDITLQKSVENKLQESNKFFSDLTDFLPDPMFVINSERKVVFWNKAMEKLTNVKSKDMVGKGDFEYAVPFYGARRPILVDLIFDNDAKGKNWDLYEKEKIEKSGDLITTKVLNKVLRPTGIYLWILAQPIFDNAGKIIYAVESIRDVNDVHQSQEELKNKIEELSAMNKVMVNRELKMIKLKEELDILKKNISQKK